MNIDINELIAELIAARDKGFTTCELCSGVDHVDHTTYFASFSAIKRGELYDNWCILFSMNHNYCGKSGAFYKPFTDTEPRFW